jgi:hypothetical protein
MTAAGARDGRAGVAGRGGGPGWRAGVAGTEDDAGVAGGFLAVTVRP